jgi:Flp pilus assembly protein TadD
MAAVLEDHGHLFARREQYTKAESAHRRALDLEQTYHEPGHPERTKLREALVRLYNAWGEPERAAEYRIGENEKATE